MDLKGISPTRDEEVLTLLAQLGDVLSSTEELDDFFQASVRMIEKVLHVEGCSIFLLNPQDNILCVKAATAIPAEEWSSIHIRLGEGIVGRVAKTGEAMQASDITRVRERSATPAHKHYKTASFISVPIQLQAQTLGVINVDSKADGTAFNPRDAMLLKGMAGLIASALSSSRLMEQQAKANRHFKGILQSVPMGVMTLDKSLHLTHCNRAAAEFLDVDPDEVVGQAAYAVFPDYLRPKIIELVTELRITGIAACCELELPPSPGERPRPMGLSAWSLDQSQGLREGVVLLLEDMSLRREISELRQLSDLKSHFLSLISHELRTPLTAVIGSLHLLDKSDQSHLDSCQQRCLAIVERNIRRLSTVVEDILEVQRIETEDAELSLETVDLEELLRKGLDSRQAIWADKEIEVELAASGGDLDQLRLDRDRISLVFKHLLDNAFKFCKINGRVWVKASVRRTLVEVRVGNSGPPIPMKYRDQIFDKFYQVECTMTRQFGGPGLGLYLARQLARLHGGDVMLEQSKPDATVFLVTLPVIPRQAPGKPVAADGESSMVRVD